MSQNTLAKELYSTRECIAAYESQRNRPDEDFCKLLDEFFNTGEMFQGLWYHAQREHLSEWFEEYVPHERESVEIRNFQPLYIPGLLQTESYMRETAPNGLVDEELITQRLARQEILSWKTNPPHLFAVIDQAALLRRGHDGRVMREQLQHLLDIGELPHIHIQAVRIVDGPYSGLNGPMVVLTKSDRSRVGYAEAQLAGRLMQDAEEVIRLGIRFDEIRCQALSEKDTRALIRKIMEECE